MSDTEEPLICEERWFSMLLDHAVQMSEHILSEVPEDKLDSSTVTLQASFVIDLLDTIIEYACRYEGFADKMEELMTMYNTMAERQVKFGVRTVQ